MGIFGGGGGGDGGAGAQAAIQQGTQQGLSELQKYYAQAVPAIKSGYGSAQGYLGPYGVAGSTAMDEYYDMLGMARPTVGTEYLSKSLQNYDALNSRVNPTTNPNQLDPSFMTETQHGKIDFTPGNFALDTREDNKGAGRYMYNTSTGNLYTAAPGTGGAPKVDQAGLGVHSVKQPDGSYRLEKLTPSGDSKPLTADEQKMYDTAKSYQNGSLAMQTSDPNSILAKLQSTPGYQFLMNQGLQGVDRSASAQGLLGSGAAIKGATDYASGLAQQTYNSRLAQLQSAAGMGAQTAGAQATLGAGQGNSLANAALGMGSNTASLYGAQSAGLAQVAAGQAAAQGQSASGGLGALGSIGGALLGNPGLFSDRRLKTDIEPVGSAPNGLTIYRFKYIGDDKVQTGFMSDEVRKIRPEAVSVVGGYDYIDYEKARV